MQGSTTRSIDGLMRGARPWPTEPDDLVAERLELVESLLLEPQRLLPPRYELERMLGRGGMGTVVLARDRSLDRRVAIKLIAGDEDETGYREARMLARLRHPGVVEVFDVGRHRGRTYIAMEYVEGESLRAWVGQRRPPALVIRTMAEVARALAAVHELGIAHLDVKPDNIVIGLDGRPRLIDFGLARRPVPETVRDDAPDEERSIRGGTPAYLAPEAFDGDSDGRPRDQYALCVTAWELLSGARPSRHDDGRLTADATLPPEVPRAAARAIRRGLAVEAERRWPSMDVLGRRLRAAPRWTVLLWLGIVVFGLLGIMHPGDGAGRVCDELESRAQRLATLGSEVFAELGGDRRAELSTELDRGLGGATSVCDAAPSAGDALGCAQWRLDVIRETLELLERDPLPPPQAMMTIQAISAGPPCARFADPRTSVRAWMAPELQRRLARARALEDRGDSEGALALLDETLDQPTSEEQAPGELAVAELQLARGQVATNLQQWDVAHAALDEAMLAAAGHDGTQLDVLQWRAYLRALRHETEAAADAMRSADAIVARGGTDAWRTAMNEAMHGVVLALANRREDALPRLEAGYAALREAAGGETNESLAALHHLAASESVLGRPEAAIEHGHVIAETLTSWYGADSPLALSQAIAWRLWLVQHRLDERLDASIDEEVERRFLATDAASRSGIEARVLLGTVAMVRREHEEARELLDEAMRGAKESYGEPHLMVMMTRSAGIRAALERGDCGGAVELAVGNLRDAEEVFGEHPEQLQPYREERSRAERCRAGL